MTQKRDPQKVGGGGGGARGGARGGEREKLSFE